MEHLDNVFVDGNWQRSNGTEAFTVVNPYTEQPFGLVTPAAAEDVAIAVRSADRALRETEWADSSLAERIAVCRGISAELTSQADELGRLASTSMGSPFAVAKGLGGCAELVDMYVDAAATLRFDYLRSDRFGDTLIRRRPVGVVAGIVPWNAPIRSEIKKIVPALIAGCSIVVKPAPETSFVAAALMEACARAGVPRGVVNMVFGGAPTGAALIRQPQIRKIAFTGSTAAGADIARAAAPEFKRLQLELGGKSAAVVLADADLAGAIPCLARGVFGNSGQLCVATSRVLVERSRYDEVVDALVTAASQHTMGDPFDPATTLGPLVTERQRTRVLAYLERGRAEGARLVAGGGKPASQPRGWFVEPTVFADVHNEMTVAREEIFGPVVVVIAVEDEQEAIRVANDSEYGLGGAVFSGDPRRALRVAQAIDSGYVAVNQFGIAPSAPFGGIKHSGIGREQGVEGYDSYLEYISYPLPRELARELAAELPTGSGVELPADGDRTLDRR